MSAERISMRKIKEILRLKFESKLTNRQIARSLNISPGTVCRYLQDATTRGFSWPLPESLNEQALEDAIFGDANKPLNSNRFVMPDWAIIHTELKKKGVTKQLLWNEYQQQHGESAYRYSQFCTHYRHWLSQQKLSMRQHHVAGEKLFVDYAGQTIPIYSNDSDEIRYAQIFIAVLPVSNYTFVEATFTQRLPDWISSHVRAFDFFEGVTEVVVPDNLRAGVSKACKYDPDINPTYQQLACHYGFAVIPARPRKPKDKAKVEVAVQIVERWILAKLRNFKFFSLGELNDAIKILLDDLNERRFSKLPETRKSLFLALDKPALKSLPLSRYQYKEIMTARVQFDYHVEVDGCFYSVPYALVTRKVEVHITNSTVHIYYQGNQMAVHGKLQKPRDYATTVDHMPENHKFYRQWSPEKFIRWAEKTGPFTTQVIQWLLAKRQHPEQGFRSCLGVFVNGCVKAPINGVALN